MYSRYHDAKQWWMEYFEVQIFHGDPYLPNIARFKRNRFTRSIYVFQSNCVERGNTWNEPGYGWGIWKKLN